VGEELSCLFSTNSLLALLAGDKNKRKLKAAQKYELLLFLTFQIARFVIFKKCTFAKYVTSIRCADTRNLENVEMEIQINGGGESCMFGFFEIRLSCQISV
jgi:hypothetical protein